MCRWGRRRPWMVGGSLGLAVCLFVIAIANNVPTLIVAWFVAQLAANAASPRTWPPSPTRSPPQQTGTVTALGGVMQNVGILAAIYLASTLTGDMIALFMVPAAFGVVGMLIYSLVLPDKQLHPRPPRSPLASSCRRSGSAPAGTRLRLGLDLPLPAGPGQFHVHHVPVLLDEGRAGPDRRPGRRHRVTGVLIYTVVLVVVGQAAGYVSDRLGRRKFLVFASTALFAVGLLPAHPGALPSAGFYLVEAILGAAYGIYMGVDLALVLAVLPNPRGHRQGPGGVQHRQRRAADPRPVPRRRILLAVGGGPRTTPCCISTAAALTFLGALAIFPVKKVK